MSDITKSLAGSSTFVTPKLGILCCVVTAILGWVIIFQSPSVTHFGSNHHNEGSLYARNDSTDDSTDPKKKSVLDLIGIRVVIGIGAFAVINVVVITIHHIVQKVRKSTSTYKEVEHVYSPF